jgi:ABC-type multidrug transport system ATPase subunit
MEKIILETAKGLKETLDKDVATASLHLIDFAYEYAITNHFQHLAIIYKLTYSNCITDEQREKVKNNMLTLTNEIVHDYRKNINSEIGRNLRVTKDKLKKYVSSQPVSKNIVFSCEHLGKTYKTSNFSLRDVSLKLCSGDITALVGENGNGKTTLFRLIAGEMQHDTGKLEFPILNKKNKKAINWREIKQQISYVPQELPKWHGSLKDMLHYEAAIHKIYGDKNKLSVKFIIERLGLGEHLNKKWFELSGGFKLRFSLAKALVWNPKLLLIDEPLANLDYKTQHIVLKDIRDLANGFKYPMSVLISSQHIHEIEVIANNILFLERGMVKFNGTINDLGNSRQKNTFELATPISYKELKNKLKNLSYTQLYHNGFTYVISTHRQQGQREVLQELLNAKVEIKYFRDISCSVKQLFK